MTRFYIPFLTALFLFAFIFTTGVQAQDDFLDDDIIVEGSSSENSSGSGLSIQEYADIPKGLMLDPEERQSKIDDGKSNLVIKKAVNKMGFNDAMTLYKKGQYAEILDDLKSLSTNGHVGAIELLGIMYRMGQGVEKNPAEALRLLNTAAMEGRPLAQHHLGTMFFAGEGTRADKIKALMWLTLASVKYPDGAEKTQAIKDRNNVADQLSRRDRIAAQEEAREWLDERGESHLLDMQ